MNRRDVTQRGRQRLAVMVRDLRRALGMPVVLVAALALGAAAAAMALGAQEAPADGASFVPDDNRGFQFDVDDGPDDGADGGGTVADDALGTSLAVFCNFYDRGADAGEKRVIVYRDAPSATTVLGIPLRSHWTIAAECAVPGGDPAATAGGGSVESTALAAVARVVTRAPVRVSLFPGARGGRHHRRVLVVAWVRRRNGHWAQLERYSVLRQRRGVMYQFGDYRVACCLDAASAYVVVAGSAVSRETRAVAAPAAAPTTAQRQRPPPPPGGAVTTATTIGRGRRA